MNIDTLPLEDHQVKLTVEVDPDTFESSKKRAARKLSMRAKIPGFRPGKAPYPVIVRHIGEAAILEEAVEITIDEIYPKVIDEAGIEPYGPGSLEDIPEMDPPTFEFIVPLRAAVELGDYQSIRLPYELDVITDDDVEDVINNLREQQAIVEPVERPAQEGDLLTIQLSAHRTHTEKDEDTTLLDNRSFPLIIEGEDNDDSEEWPFLGFSRELIGASMGDETALSHKYPDDYPNETFQGIEADFKVTVEDVRSRTLPKADDELAQSIGEYDTLDDLRNTVRESLETQSRQTYDEEYDDQIMEKIVEISTIKYPPQMLEREVESVIKNMESQLSTQGLDIDLYLKSRDMDMEGLREEATPVAESRLVKSLALMELANAEDIQIEPSELQEETTRTIDEASRVLSEDDLRELRTKEASSNLVSNIMMDLLMKRTQERLRDITRDLVSQEDSDEGEDGVLETVATAGESSASTEVADIEEPEAKATELESEDDDKDDEEDHEPVEAVETNQKDEEQIQE